jgi:CheY-like chemotaxis protein
VFENGQALLNRINSKHPDLILMDIEMPVLNGIETAKHLKKRADINKIPIIALSGHTFSDKKEEMLHAGFNDCITKPVDKGELIKVLLLYT